MPFADVLIIRVGSAIAKSILKLWLNGSTLAEDASSSLIDVLASQTSDALAQRRGQRQFEAIGEKVGENLLPIFESEGAHLDEGSRIAIAIAVAETLSKAKLSSRFLVERNLEPAKLAELLIAGSSDATCNFSATETALYQRIIKESCQYIVDIASQLPAFTEHTFAEILKREDLLLTRADQILQEVRRMRESIDSPVGAANFELEYRRAIVRNLDILELLGTDASTASRRYRLSVAYVSLLVERKSLCSYRKGISATADRITIRVDEALASSQFLLIRGWPGSGKTTLLKWIAVNAALKSFKGKMSYWNEKIPFYIRLRHFQHTRLPRPESFSALVAPAIANTMPRGWAHALLASGRAVVLVDGLDELSKTLRHDVRIWLKDLIGTYPEALFIVTSRPHAVEEGWMDHEGFSDAELQPMSKSDIYFFIDHWHDAIREELQEEDKPELSVLAERLKMEIEDSPPKRNLATTPLLDAIPNVV
jgi:hypothetical protein